VITTLLCLVLVLFCVAVGAIIYGYKRTHLQFGFNLYLSEGKTKK
jgi:hypothetical protein